MEFGFDVKRRTSLCSELVVTVQGHLPVFSSQCLYQINHRHLLCFVQCVLCFHLGITPTNVYDADGVLVVTACVCACLLDGSAFVYRSIQVDDIVVADVSPTPVIDVPLADGVNADVAAFRGGGAM